MNASMKCGRLIGIVHGESPDEALVDEVDAGGEAIVVGVNEEGALLGVTKRPCAWSRGCCKLLLRTRTSDCICGGSTKSWKRLGFSEIGRKKNKLRHKGNGWGGEVFLTRLA